MQAGLAELKQWWATFEKLELAAKSDSHAAALLQELSWPQQHFILMILMSLAETRFTFIPNDIKDGFSLIGCV